MELYSFDDAYVERLRAGDTTVQRHFVSYFSDLLRIKLRARMLPPHIIDDIRQETFARVFATLRRENGLKSSDRLGSFVNSTCNHVLLEQYRSAARTDPLAEHMDPPDKSIDLDGALVSQETSRHVQEVLGQLAAKDRELLRAVFLEERDKDEVCRELGVDRDYLRVLLHRAKAQFRTRFRKSRAADAHRSADAQ